MGKSVCLSKKMRKNLAVWLICCNFAPAFCGTKPQSVKFNKNIKVKDK